MKYFKFNERISLFEKLTIVFVIRRRMHVMYSLNQKIKYDYKYFNETLFCVR